MAGAKNKKPKFGLFITARTGSSRLPNKMLLPIAGKLVIEHDIDRACLAKKIDQVVICTSDQPEDADLANIARSAGANVYRGSLKDKLARWLGAADKFSLDYFVTFDGDDLFCDPELIDLAVDQMLEESLDFLKTDPRMRYGEFTHCIAVSALRKVCEIKDTDDTEMMWVYFTDTGLFKTGVLKVEDPIFFNGKVRMTLDYREDYEFFKRVFSELGVTTNNVPLRTILELIKAKPEIAEINWFRQEEFLDNQKNKTKLILKKEYSKTPKIDSV
ncbi:MAG: hypothetical protein Q8Q06_04900 [bacterium]|nr:hypothetical protein [bacterium]